MRCPWEGRIDCSLRRISPSTTLSEADAVLSARRKSRSKPRTRSPSMPSPNGISDCSIDIGISTSKPATLAPPSRTAARTRPISPVQISIGEPLNGAARALSSSMAMTTAGEAAGSCLRPNTSQRSAVSMSTERPWIGRSGGETETAAQISAMAATAIMSRVVRPIFKMNGPPSLIHAQQAADDRRRTGLGLRIDPEHDLRRFERGRIEAAGSQRDVLAGEIEEPPLELRAAQIDLLTLAEDVDTPHGQRAASLGLDERRGAVQCELRLRQRSNLALVDAAQHGGGDAAGCLRRGVRL